MNPEIEAAVQRLQKRKEQLSDEMAHSPIWNEYQRVIKALAALQETNGSASKNKNEEKLSKPIKKTLTPNEKKMLGVIKSMGFGALKSGDIYDKAQADCKIKRTYGSVLIDMLKKKGYLSSIKHGTLQLTQISKSLQGGGATN